jgi:hypothetical protein
MTKFRLFLRKCIPSPDKAAEILKRFLRRKFFGALGAEEEEAEAEEETVE